MKALMVITVVIIPALTVFAFDLLRDAGEFKKIEPHFSGTVERVDGAYPKL